MRTRHLDTGRSSLSSGENECIRQKINEREPYLDRIRGCMIGGAIGDALGWPIEFRGSGRSSTNTGPTVSKNMI